MSTHAFMKGGTVLVLVGALLLFARAATHAQSERSAAPRVYFHTEANKYAQDSEFVFTVLLDAPDEVNAADIEIGYSVDTLEFTGFNDAHSLINVWQKSPVAVQPGSVRFTGGMWKPFQGNAGQLMQLHFQAVAKGTATLTLQKARIYRANGLGTLIEPPLFFVNLPVTEGTPTPLLSSDDPTPPTLDIKRVENPVDRSQLLIFEAHDSDSGVREVLVRERKWFTWSEWIPAANPLNLTNNSWMLHLRAVNGARKETIATVYVWRALAAKLAMVVILLFLIGTVVMMYNKRGKTI